MEACENCGEKIGTLETPYVWKDHIVCANCHAKMASLRPRRRLTLWVGLPIIGILAAGAVASVFALRANINESQFVRQGQALVQEANATRQLLASHGPTDLVGARIADVRRDFSAWHATLNERQKEHEGIAHLDRGISQIERAASVHNDPRFAWLRQLGDGLGGYSQELMHNDVYFKIRDAQLSAHKNAVRALFEAGKAFGLIDEGETLD